MKTKAKAPNRKLADLIRRITISHGSHRERETGMCVMEAAAYIAGEPHSDHPRCVSPVITKFMIGWNDGLPSDAERDRLLKPLIPVILNTVGNAALEKRRKEMIERWLYTTYVPAWLDAASLAAEAEALRAASPTLPLKDFAPLIRKAADAASQKSNAAWHAAGDAARDAAWHAAKKAAADRLQPIVKELQASVQQLVRDLAALR